MRNIGGLLFDLDGTLLDSWPDVLAALQTIADKYGSGLIVDHDKLRGLSSLGMLALVKGALEAEQVPTEIVAEAEELYSNVPPEKQKSKLMEGMERLVDFINAKNIPWGIVTNKPKIQTLRVIERLPKLRPPSMCIICPEDVGGVEKPDPAPVLEACRRLGLPPENCSFIGDSFYDMMAGNRAKVITICARFGYLPDGVNPEKEWGAAYCIQSPSELKDFLLKGGM